MMLWINRILVFYSKGHLSYGIKIYRISCVNNIDKDGKSYVSSIALILDNYEKILGYFGEKR
ncbi:hypothetical protein [Legionella worsleiensis]|uniref:Uncharacterized protein n=1 Tax=Legionella worsleiensis TaxID=45076 RepID=A0A0W1AK82_9GAMM|nr:hypothetical protein [Legionella worsleiensis]KTD81770.1 hypothetical protein Lwor_0073 [Legionella worsleiensis]STY31158.1 Uncharacterised protein [Legionella worsleiensis]